MGDLLKISQENNFFIFMFQKLQDVTQMSSFFRYVLNIVITENNLARRFHGALKCFKKMV